MIKHTFSNLLVHIVFSTKDRLPLIKPEYRDRLHKYICGIARKEVGKALAIGGTQNHIHILLSIKPTISISTAMSKIKSLSSGWIHKTFQYGGTFEWQRGYGAFSVSQSAADSVAEYIRNQEQRHKHISYEEEFTVILRKHNMSLEKQTLYE